MIYYIHNNDTYDNIKNKIETLAPGDTLNIDAGIYNFNKLLNITVNGILNKHIVILSIGGLCIFDFRQLPYGESAIKIYGAYVHLKNLIIAYAGYKGIHSYLTDSILENIEVYGACDSGILMCAGRNTLIKCCSHDNFGYKTIKGNYIKFGFNSDGFSDKLYEGDPNTYIECESYNNTDDGFDFYKRISKLPIKLINCISHHNGKSLFNMINYPRYEIDKEWFESIKNLKITQLFKCNSTITLKNYIANGNGDGFKLGGLRAAANIELHNCKSYNNKLYGYDQNHNNGNLYLFNCDAYNNTVDYLFMNCKDNSEIIFENCKSLTNKVHIDRRYSKLVNCSWTNKEKK